jgi:hypothetical protein
MLYQFLLMVSTVLGPSTIVITVASAFQEVLALQKMLWVAYTLAIAPPIIYLAICFLSKPKTQLLVAKVRINVCFIGIDCGIFTRHDEFCVSHIYALHS